MFIYASHVWQSYLSANETKWQLRCSQVTASEMYRSTVFYAICILQLLRNQQSTILISCLKLTPNYHDYHSHDKEVIAVLLNLNRKQATENGHWERRSGG